MTSFLRRVNHLHIFPLSGQQPLITHLSTQKLDKYFSLLSSIHCKAPPPLFQIESCHDTQEYERE